MNGVAGSSAEIAFLASGTGQDFGRTYGIPTRFDDAVRVALAGTARTVDVGRVRYRAGHGAEAERLFVNVGSASDACEQGTHPPPNPMPCPEAEGDSARGGIRKYVLDGPDHMATTFKTIAHGLRNSRQFRPAVFPALR